MPKEEWGAKRSCPKCATRFYDLNQDPMTCPNCGMTVEVASLYSSETRAKAVREHDSSKSAKDELDVVLDDADDLLDDDDLVGDDDLLEEDDDDTVSLDEIADVSSDNDE